MRELTTAALATPGVAHTIGLGDLGVGNKASLTNVGVVYVILKDWAPRGKGEDLLSISHLAKSPRMTYFLDRPPLEIHHFPMMRENVWRNGIPSLKLSQ